MRKRRNKPPRKQEERPKEQDRVFRSRLKPKTQNQAELIRTIAENSVTLAMGPAGSGKTKVAVAYGIEKLLLGEFKRLVVTRPVVEAGERLGYLPGSFAEKIDPYLQPVYYELLQYLSKAQLQEFINNGVSFRGSQEIIIAPLAYMRGMNYHDAYMVLDEAQNCTQEQIKLFITRVGFNSKAVLVGDDKQSDLHGGKSGLYHWYERLQGIQDVGTFRLENVDIVRNPVISRILSKIGE
jgi:phosphate starvation-inducible PhoH-like protein